MMGVIIVNPAGTTYPITQAQYDTQAQQETQADYAAGEKAVSGFQLQKQKNANGTTTYMAQTDFLEAQAYSFKLSSIKTNSVSGTALVAFSEPPSPQTNMNVTYSVSAKLAGLTPGQTYTAILSEGGSGSGVMVPSA